MGRMSHGGLIRVEIDVIPVGIGSEVKIGDGLTVGPPLGMPAFAKATIAYGNYAKAYFA